MKVVIAGDFAPKDRLGTEVNSSKRDLILSKIKPILMDHDYSIVNLEAPIVSAPSQIPVKLNLSANDNSVVCLKNAGFQCATLANNHLRDYLNDGVTNTLHVLDKYQLDHVGGGKDLKDAQKVLYKEINGEVLSVINVCEHEFSIATDKRPGAAPLDLVQLFYNINEARNKAKYVILIIHGGHEHYQLPSPRMKTTYRCLIDMGADVIVNHHQHCFSGYEIYHDKPIFYGIGNFCFDWSGKRNSIWNEGFMVSLDFSSKISIALIPFIQCNDHVSVEPMNENQQQSFYGKIEELNNIIQDDTLLQSHFSDLILRKSFQFDLALSPYTNRYLKSLCRRGAIPSFKSKEKQFFLYNYINCESHRDLFLAYLANNSDTDK